MKRKIFQKLLTILLIMIGILTVTACGTVAEEPEEKDAETTQEWDKDSEKKDGDSTKDEEEAAKEEGDFTKETVGAEFTYLFCETLVPQISEDTDGEGTEGKEFQVFIPKGDYTSVNGNTAYADAYGTEFRITLNPYIRYETEKYTQKENLQYYLDYNYSPFYSTDCKEVEISPIQEWNNGVYATVKYCYYDSWEEEYIPIFCTYYITELSKGVSMLVEIEVNAEDVTDETETLLEELETVYAIEIVWDKEEAAAKLEHFLATADTDTNSFFNGFLLFELPKNWDQDYAYNDFTTTAYAPGGDAVNAGCVIDIRREYMGLDSFDVKEITASEKDREAYADNLKESLEDKAENITVEYYGGTNMGNAMKITYTVTDGGEESMVVRYLISDENYLYSIEAIADSDCTEEVFEIAEDILNNSIVKD